MLIREAISSDEEAIWAIMQPIIAAGETYTFSPQSTKEQLLAFWCAGDKHVFVAEKDGKLLGTFFIKANQATLGAHIANAGFMTHPEATGQGIGWAMGKRALIEAKQLGFHAMQFNFVVKSNQVALRLWQKLGFEIIGEIPDAFQHPRLGLTNAYIMYQKL